jgi:putative tryptophan/tyrosine transport system substrate-binding protein
MMHRRAFLGTLSLLAAPLAVEAQQAGRVYRVGILASVIAPTPLAQPLRALGWVEGQNLVFERRYDEGKRERLPVLAAELAERNVSLIFALGTPAAQAAKAATATIPIVIIFVADPVRSGLVTSLARPGGNITGMAFFGPDVVKKQLETLKEAVPQTASVGILFDPLNTAQIEQLAQEIPAAAAVLSLKTHSLKVDASIPLNTVFAEARQKRADALLVYPLNRPGVEREIASLAIKHQLPTVTTFRRYVDQGVLMSFGASADEQYQRAASYIDRILRGAKPGDLAVEQPSKFELVINLKTAKALGLSIPPSLLQRADQVIES